MKRFTYLRFYFSQETKLDRELNVELMDMGMRVAHDMDPKVIWCFLQPSSDFCIFFLFFRNHWNIFLRVEPIPCQTWRVSVFIWRRVGNASWLKSLSWRYSVFLATLDLCETDIVYDFRCNSNIVNLRNVDWMKNWHHWNPTAMNW